MQRQPIFRYLAPQFISGSFSPQVYPGGRLSVLIITLIFISGITGTKGFSAPNAARQLEGKIVVSTSEKVGNISPDIYGLFMELVLRQFDGGVWAEMLKSRKFAEDDGEPGEEYYGVVRPWFAIGRNEKTHFAHDNTIYYTGNQSQKIISEDHANRRIGIGQDKLYFEKEKNYHVRVNLKQQGIAGLVTIALEGDNSVYAKKEITITDTDWSRFSFILKPGHTDRNGRFTITFNGCGTLWVGTASLMADDNVSGFRKDVVEAIRAIRPPNIRWPGGNISSCYHWEDGIADRDKRPPRYDKAFPNADEWLSNDVGIDEFMELCRLTGAKPCVALNAGDGTVQEAANWVEYCNGGLNTKYGKLRAQNGHPEPYGVKLWGIGNEMFGNWQIGHVDEETYAKRHLAIAKAILAVDKNIKIVASGGRYWKYPRWNQALFKIAGEYFDYLSLHSYAKKYRSTLKKQDLKDPKLAEETYYYIVSSPYGLEEQIIETDKEIRKALPGRPEVKIAFDEWNAMLYRTPKTDFALRDGIYAAGVLHAFRRQLKTLTLANFASVVNMIPLIRVNEYGIFFNPQYLVFRMYLNHSGPTLLGTVVKCDGFAAPEYEKGRPQAKGHIPYLDVSATMSKDENIVYVAVVNLHADKNIKTWISFEKWDFSSKVKLFELYDDDYMAENTFEQPDRLTIKEGILSDISNPFGYNFKPHSVTIMEFRK